MCLQFNVEITDSGIPTRTATASVEINVLAVGIPTFNPPFVADIVDYVDIGTEVIKINAQHPVASVSTLFIAKSSENALLLSLPLSVTMYCL